MAGRSVLFAALLLSLTACAPADGGRSVPAQPEPPPPPRVVDRFVARPGGVAEPPATWPDVPREVVRRGSHPQSGVQFRSAWFDEERRVFLEFGDQGGRCPQLVTFNADQDFARRLQAGGWSVWLRCTDDRGKVTFEDLAAR